MKSKVRTLLMLLLAVISINNAKSQSSAYSTNNGLAIGFGIGGSYQQSDIKNSIGSGFDLWLGTNIFKKENAFLAVDWKFRFLTGINKAHDHRENFDGTYSNIRYNFYNYDLELGLTLNRLRERTRIIITGFAGVGVTHGLTFTDLYDAGGNLYDYLAINPNDTQSEVNTALLNLSDNEYETSLSNRGAIMPTLGIYIGYQLTPGFSIGIQHKTNFSLNESNGTFGIDIDNSITTGSPIDMNHYTSLGFRWTLGGRSASSSARNNYPEIERSPVIYNNTKNNIPVSTTKPGLIDRRNRTTRPLATTRINTSTNPVTTTNQNRTTNPVTTTVPVTTTRTGNTTIPVSTTPAKVPLPVIKYINPPSPITVDNKVFSLRAQTTNVAEWQDVKVKVDGKRISNFSFSRDGLVNLNIGLIDGPNRIEVSGKNKSGTITEVTIITYKKAVVEDPVIVVDPIVEDPVVVVDPPVVIPPIINILMPAQGTIKTFEAAQKVTATVVNVEGKENISVNINGTSTGNFTYNKATTQLNINLTLVEGQNRVIINAQNKAGNDSESRVFVKEIRPCPTPGVNIIEPSRSGITTDKKTYNFRAGVRNISNKNELALNFNGTRVSNFSFTGNELRYTASLKSGNNTFDLIATNDCGSESVKTTLNYVPIVVVVDPCVPPVLNFVLSEVNTDNATHEIKGNVSNIKSKADITLSVNGTRDNGFQFQNASGIITRKFNFSPGTYSIVVSVKNECGSDSKTGSVTVEKPCVPPMVNFNLTEVNRSDATHTLRGTITNIENNNSIQLTINGKSYTSFTYNANSKVLEAKLKLEPGNSTLVVKATNSCGEDSKSKTVIIKEETPCGVRINPGNSAWQFCLITPGGTYNRDNLANKGFSYSGTASSLYFKPIAGGGDAIVNGKPYKLKSGQYYLFTGNLSVSVSSKNPGSMGKWSVCITTNKAPVTGNGNNRPTSPCEDKGKN